VRFVKSRCEYLELPRKVQFHRNYPTQRGFAYGPSGLFFFPSSAHRGNFEQVQPLCNYGTESDPKLIRTSCLIAAKISQFFWCGQTGCDLAFTPWYRRLFVGSSH
jgi:hypothetical protein